MIDTVKLRSPYLSEQVASLVEQHLKRRLAVQIDTGEVLWELTCDELAGSWDNRISVRIWREQVVTLEPIKNSKGREQGFGKAVSVMEPCPPYLVVEGSVHKAMTGHNITGGPLSFQAAVCWFANELSAYVLRVALPYAPEWWVERVDMTECYCLPVEAIDDFITSMNAAQYPRRKAIRYGSESIFFPGTTTSAKVYHKGPEFWKHDRKRLRELVGEGELYDLQMLANGIMRVEVCIKAKKLKADFGGKPTVVQVTDAYLEAVHDREVAKFLKEGQSDMETVREAQDVVRRLGAIYAHRQRGGLTATLYGLWVQLATIGEGEVKKHYPLSTYKRLKKQLAEAGISWAGTNVMLRETAIPADFSLCRTSRYRDAQEDPRITELLRSYREAV
jgi:II/X family phage/plasmid replication protein